MEKADRKNTHTHIWYATRNKKKRVDCIFQLEEFFCQPTNQPHGTEELVFAAKDNRLSLWVAPFYPDALRLVYTLGREDTVQRERKITK